MCRGFLRITLTSVWDNFQTRFPTNANESLTKANIHEEKGI